MVSCLVSVETSIGFLGPLYTISNNNNINNNNNASISIVQNKLSAVLLMADQTHMSLVFWQKSAEKRMQNKC